MTKHRGSRSATRELAICFQHRPAACQVDLRGRASAVPDNDIATTAISVGDIDLAQRRICKGSPANVDGGENEFDCFNSLDDRGRRSFKLPTHKKTKATKQNRAAKRGQ